MRPLFFGIIRRRLPILMGASGISLDKVEGSQTPVVPGPTK